MAEHPEAISLLLVDDEVGYLEVLSKRLTRRGFKVTTAAWDFDVAVVDLKMEDMDGIEVLKVLKRMVPALHVIILTGHGSERAAREGIAQGAFDYLIKPIGLDPLIARIHAAMSLKTS